MTIEYEVIVIPEHVGEIYRPYIIVGIADHRDKYNHKLYLAHCMFCDVQIEMRLVDLKDRHSCYCRCNAIHLNNGIKDTRLQVIFNKMKNRCYNDTNKDYRFYGGKGIKVCTDWMKNPCNFEMWAFENGYKSNLTIDRIDSSKNYSPENCRWITREDNARYKSSTIVIEVDGIQLTGKQWSKKLGIGTNTINTIRREHGDEIVKELIHKMMEQKPNIEVFRSSGKSWLEAYGIRS